MGVLRAKVDGIWVDIGTPTIVGTGNPVGSIIAWAGATAPYGYLACDGTAISRLVYAELFAAIGTTWGVGDGSTTFNLPDLAGRSPIGAGAGSGLTTRTVGTKLGEETHLLTAAESGVPAHLHSVDPPSTQVVQPGTLGGTNQRIYGDYGPSAGTNSAIPGSVSNQVGGNAAYVDIAAFNSANNTAANAASAHNVIQPSTVVTFVIRAFSGTAPTGTTAPLSPTPWTGVTYQNSWVDGSGIQAMQYRKEGDRCQIRGYMRNGTLSTVAFTLPPLHRPPAILNVQVIVSGAAAGGYWAINPDGTVYVYGPSNVLSGVNGILEFSVTP